MASLSRMEAPDWNSRLMHSKRPMAAAACSGVRPSGVLPMQLAPVRQDRGPGKATGLGLHRQGRQDRDGEPHEREPGEFEGLHCSVSPAAASAPYPAPIPVLPPMGDGDVLGLLCSSLLCPSLFTHTLSSPCTQAPVTAVKRTDPAPGPLHGSNTLLATLSSFLRCNSLPFSSFPMRPPEELHKQLPVFRTPRHGLRQPREGSVHHRLSTHPPKLLEHRKHACFLSLPLPGVVR